MCLILIVELLAKLKAPAIIIVCLFYEYSILPRLFFFIWYFDCIAFQYISFPINQ